jgi:hypothetical protein
MSRRIVKTRVHAARNTVTLESCQLSSYDLSPLG